ncbi:MAG: PaaI family thioesterase [Verrucomicrobium sp.]
MRSSVPFKAPTVHLNRVSKLFVDANVIRDLGATRRVLEKGRSEAKVVFPGWMGVPHESMHAVAQASLADHAAEAAVDSLFAQEGHASNLDFKMKYVSSAEGAVVRAEARVVRCSRGIAVVEVDVYAGATEAVVDDTLVAVAEATYVVDDDSVTFPKDKEHLVCFGWEASMI